MYFILIEFTIPRYYEIFSEILHDAITDVFNSVFDFIFKQFLIKKGIL